MCVCVCACVCVYACTCVCVCVCARARVVLASTYIPIEVSLEFWQAANGRDGPLRLQRCQYRHEIHIQLATSSEPHKVVRTKIPAAGAE